MFEEGEAAACPICGVALKAFEKLPPSPDAHAVDPENAPKAPEYEPLPLTYLGRAKGPLLALALVGIGLFMAPWIHMTLPNDELLSGFDVARRLGWSWGAGVAWVVLVPTVLSRRSIVQMRGARVAAAFLSLVPAVTAAILLLRPPRGAHHVPLRFTWEWPMWAILAVSALAFVFALRLGGRADDIRVKRGTSEGHTLH